MIKRGASLIWAMVMSTALLFIAVTTATFVIRESQMSIRMDESSMAYAAAESGIDWGKYCVQSLSQCTSLAVGTSFGPSVFYVGGSKYVVIVEKEATQTRIESTGTSNGVNRKLEYVIKNINNLDSVSDAGLNASLQTSGSYVQQFDYWATGSRFANIGIGNNSSSPTQGIYLSHKDVSGVPYIYLVAKNGATIKEVGLPLPGIDISAPYSLRIRIEYFKDLSAKMTVSKRSFVSGMPEFSCIGSALVLDVRSLGLSPASFTNFYFNSALTTVTDSKYGDGNVKKLMSGTSEAYFDNMATTGINIVVPITLTYTAGANGTITGASPQLVTSGGSGTAVTAEPNVGKVFIKWSDDSTQNPRTDTNVVASLSVTAIFGSAWVAMGPAIGISAVYYMDNIDTVTFSGKWKSTTGYCLAPQCTTGLEKATGLTGAKSFDVDNSIIFNGYPARAVCQALGGRLPTVYELQELYLRNSNIDFRKLSGSYWSATERHETQAYTVSGPTGFGLAIKNIGGPRIRCVK